MKHICFFLTLIVLFSCSEEMKNNFRKRDNRVLEPNVLNLSFLYSEGEKIISFPLWFNDSIIRERGIRSINRTFYYELNDSSDTEIEMNSTPEKKITYSFDKNGTPKEIQIGNFYDNRLISTIKGIYSDFESEIGYAKVKLSETLRTEDFPYHEFRQVSSSKDLTIFENIATQTKLLVIPDKKHWKPLIIDTLCSPNKNDLIVWGSLRHPKKIYQVDNLVEESNVRDFTYKDGILKHIEWTDDPFKIHRTFQFDKQGLCTGFVDSTFSMGDFVASAHYLFELKDRLPVSVTKEVRRGDVKRIVFRETFEYLFE